MPATARNAQFITRAGIAETFTAVDNTNGETVPNNGQLFAHIKNAGGGACTVTIPLPNTQDGQAVASRTVVVPATTGDRLIGPFPPGQYNDANGNVNFGFSTGTSVTAAYVVLLS